MKEQIERIHEKYEDTWACMMDYLPDCSTCIEYWRGRLDQVYYRTITTLCEAECQARVDEIVWHLRIIEGSLDYSDRGMFEFRKMVNGYQQALKKQEGVE